MLAAMMRHWPEYLIEAALLGVFMVSACVSVATIEHPASPVRRRVRSATARRGLIGLAMGATAVLLILSPWGERSGAHMNPATTLAFYTLGKIDGVDAAWYVIAQFLGGLAGVWVCVLLMPRIVGHASVGHVVTVPGSGRGARRRAWLAEFAISMGLLLSVLALTNQPGLKHLAPFAVGALLTAYITLEAPISGMSINPARTLASAIPAGRFTGLWIYMTAPTLGMLAAAWTYAAATGPEGIACAKLNHSGQHRCIFRCSLAEANNAQRDARSPRPDTPSDIEGR